MKHPIAATLTLVALGSLAGCGGEPPPPPSVAELLADPVLLDATMVRCLRQHGGTTNYAVECINAREAAGQLALAAEKARQHELEAQSARKREALRRAQESADAARQQALELAQERETAEFLGLLVPAPATAEATPVQRDELHFITIGEETPLESADFIAAGDEVAPQVTVQEIDLGGVAVPVAPPEPEPEAE